MAKNKHGWIGAFFPMWGNAMVWLDMTHGAKTAFLAKMFTIVML